jgi:hypothetical protein
LVGESAGRSHLQKIFSILKISLLILAAIATFPHLLPHFRDNSLDQSWVMGLNEAAKRGMVFGKEIVFTYGPLGFIDCPIDTGNNVSIAAKFRLVIYLLFLCSVALNAYHCRSFAVSSLYVFIFIAMTSMGSRINFLIERHLLLGVLGFLTFSVLRQSFLWAIPAGALAGLALLVKFSIGMACASTFAVWALLTLTQNPNKRTLLKLSIGVVVFLFSLLGLYSLFGGPPTGLFDYLKYSSIIASGYSSQMSVPCDHVLDLVLAIFQIVLISALVIGGVPSNRRYLILLILLAPALFFLFKGGFVRSDRSHAEDYFTVVPVAAGFFLLIAKDRWEKIAVSTLVLAVLMMSFGWHFSLSSTFSFSNPVANGYDRIRAFAPQSPSREAIRNRDAEVTKKQKLPPQILAKVGTQRVDAYPWDISIPLANGLNWSPRMVFQSYQAYAPELDTANAQHYGSEDGPDFILYSHKAIDDQHPMTTDPSSWLAIYRWYDIEEEYAYAGLTPLYLSKDLYEDMLLLRRRSTPRFGEPVLLGEKDLHLGERWEIPTNSGEFILLKANFKLRTLGKWRDWCFKNYAPTVFVEYQNGVNKKYRLVWRNAANGLLVSDLPLDLSQVKTLWKGGEGCPVKAITFSANEKHFKTLVSIGWLKVPLAVASDK